MILEDQQLHVKSKGGELATDLSNELRVHNALVGQVWRLLGSWIVSTASSCPMSQGRPAGFCGPDIGAVLRADKELQNDARQTSVRSLLPVDVALIDLLNSASVSFFSTGKGVKRRVSNSHDESEVKGGKRKKKKKKKKGGKKSPSKENDKNKEGDKKKLPEVLKQYPVFGVGSASASTTTLLMVVLRSATQTEWQHFTGCPLGTEVRDKRLTCSAIAGNLMHLLLGIVQVISSSKLWLRVGLERCSHGLGQTMPSPRQLWTS